MRLWTIILTMIDRRKISPCQSLTNLTEDDIGMPIEKYLKLREQWHQDCQKQSSNKHLLHSAD